MIIRTDLSPQINPEIDEKVKIKKLFRNGINKEYFVN
jgi:hypothetical protein